MDMRSGALLAKPPTGEDGPYQYVFPIGFYTQYGSYLASNLSIPGILKEQGCVENERLAVDTTHYSFDSGLLWYVSQIQVLSNNLPGYRSGPSRSRL